ncbi:hypothetical protein ABK040_016553 [Willaertia magna]
MITHTTATIIIPNTLLLLCCLLFLFSTLTSISYQQTCFGLPSEVACLQPSLPFSFPYYCSSDNTCELQNSELPPYNSFFFGNNLKGQLDYATAGNSIVDLPTNTTKPDTKILVVDIKLFENYTLFVDFNGVMYSLGDVYNNGQKHDFSAILGENGQDERKGVGIIGDEYARGILTWDNKLFVRGENLNNNLGLNDFVNSNLNDFVKYASEDKIVLDVDFNQYSSCKLVYEITNQSVIVETSGLINYILQNKPDNEYDVNVLQNYKFNHTLLYNNGEIDVQMGFVTKYRLFLLKISTGSLLIFGNNYIYEVTLPTGELIIDYKCITLNDNNDEEKLLMSHSNFVCVLKSNKENIYAFGNVTTHPCLQNVTNYFDTFTPILIYRNNDYTNNLINQIEISKLNILFTLQKDGNLYACGYYNNYQSFKDHEVFKKYNLFNNIVQDNINYNPPSNLGNNYFINNRKISEVTSVKFNRIAIPRQTNKIWKFGVSKKGDSIFIIPYRSTCSGDFLPDPDKSTTCIPQYKCYNVSAYDKTKVCNGKGSCILDDICKCDTNYYGNRCDVFKCFNIWNTDTNVCSSAGTCVANDICKCKEGFKGRNCEIVLDYTKVISKQQLVFNEMSTNNPNSFISTVDLQLVSTNEEYNQFMSNLNSYDFPSLSLQYNLFFSGKIGGMESSVQIATLQKLNYVVFNNGSYFVSEGNLPFSYPLITSRNYPEQQEIYKEGAVVTSFSKVTTSGFIYSIGTLVSEKPMESNTLNHCGRSITISSTAQTDPVVITVISKLNSTNGECVWAKFIFDNEITWSTPTKIIVKEDIFNNKDIVIATIDKRKSLGLEVYNSRLIALDVPYNNQGETTRFDKEFTSGTVRDCRLRDIAFASSPSGEPFVIVIGYFNGPTLTLKETPQTFILNHYYLGDGNNYQMFMLNVSLSGNFTAEKFDLFGDPFSLIVNDNEIYFAGYTTERFDGQGVLPNNYIQKEGIIRKLSQNLQTIWEIRFFNFGDYTNEISVKNMYLDSRGELYINGIYTLEFSYNGTDFKILEASANNAFIMRLDSNNGNLLWSTYLTNSTQNFEMTNIVEDAVGNLIIGNTIGSSFTTEDGKTMFDGITGKNGLLTFYNLNCYHQKTGALCQDFNCHGFSKNDKKRVCNGIGKCTAPNNCDCSPNPNYTGTTCSEFNCFGKFHQDWGNVCSGRGQCIAHNLCKCNDGFYGENCEYFKCFGNENDNLNIQNENGGKVLPSMANVLCRKLNKMRK